MKTISILITLVFLFSLTTGVFAQETELPDPGLTPDSPFYFLETISEAIGTFFTFGDLKKAERHAILAAERLAEAQAVVEKGKPELVEKTLERYESQLNKSMARAEKAMNKGKDFEKVMEVMARVGNATSKHLEVLAEVYEKVPEEAKTGIENAMAVSIKGHEKAVEALKGGNSLGNVPEQAPIPTGFSSEVRERIQTKVEVKSMLEEALEVSESSKDLCIKATGEIGGGEAAEEMCDKVPSRGFKSFGQLKDFCTEMGGQAEVCATLESMCKQFGITNPDECFVTLMSSSSRAYTSGGLKTVPASTLPE